MTETIVVAFDRAAYNQGQNAQFNPAFEVDGVAFTLVAKGPGGVALNLEAARKNENKEQTDDQRDMDDRQRSG